MGGRGDSFDEKGRQGCKKEMFCITVTGIIIGTIGFCSICQY